MIKREILKRFVAKDASNYEFAEFDTKKEAEEWLNEWNEDGISNETLAGMSYIAEIQYQSEYRETDSVENYEDEEDWGHDSDTIGDVVYERIVDKTSLEEKIERFTLDDIDNTTPEGQFLVVAITSMLLKDDKGRSLDDIFKELKRYAILAL